MVQWPTSVLRPPHCTCRLVESFSLIAHDWFSFRRESALLLKEIRVLTKYVLTCSECCFFAITFLITKDAQASSGPCCTDSAPLRFGPQGRLPFAPSKKRFTTEPPLQALDGEAHFWRRRNAVAIRDLKRQYGRRARK